MLNEELENTVCGYYNTDIAEAMDKTVHTRRATEARYFIWYFLRYYRRIPAVMIAEIYGFSKRQVACGIAFIRDAVKYQTWFRRKLSELAKMLGYPQTCPKETVRMYVKRGDLI